MIDGTSIKGWTRPLLSPQWLINAQDFGIAVKKKQPKGRYLLSANVAIYKPGNASKGLADEKRRQVEVPGALWHLIWSG
jgi:hypothetical protein